MRKQKVAKTLIRILFYFFIFVAKSHDNRSNGGVAFVFVRIFGIETRLGVCEIPKILTSAKLHTPEQIVFAQF